jgi:hypothetical protein
MRRGCTGRWRANEQWTCVGEHPRPTRYRRWVIMWWLLNHDR